jgi:hypothetical protein
MPEPKLPRPPDSILRWFSDDEENWPVGYATRVLRTTGEFRSPRRGEYFVANSYRTKNTVAEVMYSDMDYTPCTKDRWIVVAVLPTIKMFRVSGELRKYVRQCISRASISNSDLWRLVDAVNRLDDLEFFEIPNPAAK